MNRFNFRNFEREMIQGFMTRQPKSYFTIIDVLRAVACLIICVYHLFGFKENGEYLFETNTWFMKFILELHNAIVVFFVISGFVVPFSYFNSTQSNPSLFRFIIRRLTRIYLPFLASIVLILVIKSIQFTLSDTLIEWDFSRFFSNILFICDFTHQEWFNPIFWTSAIEIQFYFLMLLLFLLSKNVTKSLPWLLIGGCLFVNNFIEYFFQENHIKTVFDYLNYFSFGFIVCFYFLKQLSGLSVIFLLVLVSISTFNVHGLIPLIFCLFSVGTIIFINLRIKPLEFIGKFSYSFYLTHGLSSVYVLNKLVQYQLSPIALAFSIIGLIIVGLLFAYVFYQMIELPTLKLLSSKK